MPAAAPNAPLAACSSSRVLCASCAARSAGGDGMAVAVSSSAVSEPAIPSTPISSPRSCQHAASERGRAPRRAPHSHCSAKRRACGKRQRSPARASRRVRRSFSESGGAEAPVARSVRTTSEQEAKHDGGEMSATGSIARAVDQLRASVERAAYSTKKKFERHWVARTGTRSNTGTPREPPKRLLRGRRGT